MGGYRSQGVQPICVETCDPIYTELIKLQTAVFHELLTEYLKPGITVGELSDACNRITDKERPGSGPASDAKTQLTMHGRGAGDDGPIITNSAKDPKMLALPLEANMVLIFKPQVTRGDGSYPTQFGDSVVITPSGGIRLGDREPGMWVAPTADAAAS